MKRRSISTRVRFEVLRAYNFACAYCGAPASLGRLEIDHMIPVALGGTNDPWNLAPACVDCNGGKFDTAPTREMVDEARLIFSMSAQGRGFVRCRYCGIPFRPDPDDAVPEEPQCERCSEIMCWSYDAGCGIVRPMRSAS